MNPQQHFFQSFGFPNMPQPEADPTPEYIKQNESILEISNNWIHIKQLIKKAKRVKPCKLMI